MTQPERMKRRVENFVKRNGKLGRASFLAYTNIDPFHRFHGMDSNLDEYLEYVKRFLRIITEKGQGLSGNDKFPFALLEDAVRQSFYTARDAGPKNSNVVEFSSAKVTNEDVRRIAEEILSYLPFARVPEICLVK